MNVPLPYGTNAFEIDNAWPNLIQGYTCGNKKVQGYFIYFFDKENYITGKPSNYSLPRVTLNPAFNGNGGWQNAPDGYEYCLTASYKATKYKYFLI